MSRIVVTGATGTIGRALVELLRTRGDEVIALSRHPDRARRQLAAGVKAESWPDPTGSGPPRTALSGADAIVHLLGEPIAQRWSETAKRAIRESRVLSTRNLVTAVRELPAAERPAVLVSQSATGYYGSRGEQEINERAPAGSDFLAQVVVAWEREALGAESLMRVVLTRTGVVLTRQGGALAQMLPFFRLGLGGPVAGGRQYVPWVHLADVTEALSFCVTRAQAAGPVNLSAPRPVTNLEFSRALGRVLGRPAVLPVPGLALRLLYGEMAEVVTVGARVVPERLLEMGFEFAHPAVEEALAAVLGGG